MKAIVTKYLCATDHRGTRIKATDGYDRCNTVTIEYDDDKSGDENHLDACCKLCEKMNWHGTLHGGHPQGGVMVWVFECNPLSIPFHRFTV